MHPDPDVSAEGAAALEQAERLSAGPRRAPQLRPGGPRGERVAAGARRRAGGGAATSGRGRWRRGADAAGAGRRGPAGAGRRRRGCGRRSACSSTTRCATARGTITISGRLSDKDTIVVEVSDNGDGVPSELAPHVFDRGVSGAASTGVGLALARALSRPTAGGSSWRGRGPRCSRCSCRCRARTRSWRLPARCPRPARADEAVFLPLDASEAALLAPSGRKAAPRARVVSSTARPGTPTAGTPTSGTPWRAGCRRPAR